MKNRYIYKYYTVFIRVDFKILISCRFYNCRRRSVKIKTSSSAITPFASEHATISLTQFMTIYSYFVNIEHGNEWGFKLLTIFARVFVTFSPETRADTNTRSSAVSRVPKRTQLKRIIRKKAKSESPDPVAGVNERIYIVQPSRV